VICTLDPIGPGREPTVFWGTHSVRGGCLALQRDVGGLEPDGCEVRHTTADTSGTKTGMRLRPHVRSGVCPAERNGTKLANVV